MAVVTLAVGTGADTAISSPIRGSLDPAAVLGTDGPLPADPREAVGW